MQESSAAISAHLAPYLLAGYRRQAHITIGLCGFPMPRKQLGDDYGPACLARQIAALEALCLEPFTLEVGAPASFTSAAYFTVHEGGGSICRAHRALGGVGDAECPYLPHVTFGLYRERFPMAEVMAQMQLWRTKAALHFPISRLTLMVYEAAVIGGPLSSVGEFDLGDQRWRIVDAGLMEVLFGSGQG